MKDYLLFVDETKANKYHPNFCFAGIAVEREYYEKFLIRDVCNLKIKHFGTSDVIFHFSDMKKNRNEFSTLLNEEKRNDFWADLFLIFFQKVFIFLIQNVIIKIV